MARRSSNLSAAIVGESLAGLFVVETFLLGPDLFDTYIAFDLSLWWNNQKLVGDAGERLRARPKTEKTLYFASSDEKGIVDGAQRFADVFGKDAASGVHWHYERMPDENTRRFIIPPRSKLFARCSSRL